MSQSSDRLDRIERDIDETRERIDGTLDALAGKVSPDRLMGQAVEVLRSNGGEFAGNAMRAVRENPVALAMMAGGFAWMLMSDRRRRGHAAEAPAHAPARAHADFGGTGARPHATTPVAPGSPVAGSAEMGIGDRVRAAAGRAQDTADAAAGQAAAGAHRAGEATRHAGERAGEAAARAGDAAAHAGRTAATAAGAAAHGVRAAVHDLRDGIGEAGRAAGRDAAGAYAGLRDAGQRTASYVMDNPMVLGAVGLVLGGVLAAALPATRREDRWLGEAGERVREEAADTARAAVATGERAAREAVHSAKDEAKRQKLTPKEAKRTVQDAAEQAARGGAEVAKAAVRAAEDQTRRRTGNGAPRTH